MMFRKSEIEPDIDFIFLQYRIDENIKTHSKDQTTFDIINILINDRVEQ